VNLEVLHVLDAIADLALENNIFYFQLYDMTKRKPSHYNHYRGATTDYHPMDNLYPVILYWLFKEVRAADFIESSIPSD
jgi:hypothetical protein